MEKNDLTQLLRGNPYPGRGILLGRSADGDPSCCLRYFYTYDHPLSGEGRFIHTYQTDGDPLPSFQGEPVRVSLTAPDPESLAAALWEALDPDNKVSLFVRYTALEDGSFRQVIHNKF